MKSQAVAAQEYLAELPDDHRAVVAAVRAVVIKSVPKGYREAMNWGSITYVTALERYSDTYNKQALNCADLAAQKIHLPSALTVSRFQSPPRVVKFQRR